MRKRNRVAIITEGVRREPDYVNYLRKQFAFPPEIDFICLPADKNIYMLWNQMQLDDFDTDVIEVVRECSEEAGSQLTNLKRDDFREVYLLFDFDPHQNNLSLDDGTTIFDVLKTMSETFDNETELGKLYISYPMVEALRDISDWSCRSYYRCAIPSADVPKYKQLSGDRNRYSTVKKYTPEIWSMILAIFLQRCKCLFEQKIENNLLLSWYKNDLSPYIILEKQIDFFRKTCSVFVLSAFPELLLGLV